MWCRHFEINWSDDTRESPRLSDVPDSKVLTNTLLGTQMAKDPLPAPEDNVKPLNYKELFEVRSQEGLGEHSRLIVVVGKTGGFQVHRVS